MNRPCNDPAEPDAAGEKEVSTLANIFGQVKKNSLSMRQHGCRKGVFVPTTKKMTIIGVSYAKINNLFKKG